MTGFLLTGLVPKFGKWEAKGIRGAASRSATWQPFYQRYRDRGLSRIHSLVILARKLARVAFALMKNQTTYQPKPHIQPCAGT